MEAFFQDVRYALRMLRRSPAFTLTAIVMVALGIGGNSAIFSVVSGVLLRPLPYPDAGQLAMVWMDNSRISLREDWHSFPNYADYRAQNTTFADMAVFNNTSRTLSGDGDPERLIGAHTSAHFFDVLGVRPAHGRAYTREEDGTSGANVVVLSHGLWQRRFGGRTDVLNSTVSMSGRPMQVIGIMPDGFSFPSRDTQFWIPTAASEQQRANRGSLWLQVVGRMKSGVAVEQAQADLERVNAGLLQQFPGQKGYGIYVSGYREQMVGRIRPAILVLLGAVGFVLLIACANVANLMLARANGRRKEMAIRLALGAARARLVRQLLTESALLAIVGGGLGLLLAYWLIDALSATTLPLPLPIDDNLALDGRVIVFTTLLALVTGVLFGLAPALQTSRPDVVPVLKNETVPTGAPRRGRLAAVNVRQALVVSQVALSLISLVAAALFVRSLRDSQRVDTGFERHGVLIMTFNLGREGYTPERGQVFYQQVAERVGQLRTE
jgi:putative ABC transport system permease protein